MIWINTTAGLSLGSPRIAYTCNDKNGIILLKTDASSYEIRIDVFEEMDFLCTSYFLEFLVNNYERADLFQTLLHPNLRTQLTNFAFLVSEQLYKHRCLCLFVYQFVCLSFAKWQSWIDNFSFSSSWARIFLVDSHCSLSAQVWQE